LFLCPANRGRFGHGGLPVEVTHRLSSNRFAPGGDKFRISKPTGGDPTCIGGLPAITFLRMVFPLAPGNTRIPLMFPPIPFSSMMLPLLVPTKPTPKSLAPDAMEPLPANSLRRTRLLWLLVTQTPPQGKALDADAFLTDTTSSTRLSLTLPANQTPLKQF
jgi:hypothetical protein